MGKRERDKGARIEREIVHRHEEMGVHAQRVPLSGAAGGRFSGDVDVYVMGLDAAPFVTEVKARANASGFKSIKQWLGENDALFLREDGEDPLVVLSWPAWKLLMERKNG